MKTKIFLTGSTGYLGTKFVDLYGLKFDILEVSRSAEPSIDLLDVQAVKHAYREFKPDYIVHLAADTGRDSTTSDEIIKSTSQTMADLIQLAQIDRTPFIFSSTEAVYGGKKTGGYHETDAYNPRSSYGASKVAAEQLLKSSGLPYLITRGHRHVGVSKRFKGPKQFPDTLSALERNEVMHLDSRKVFTPVLINHVCDIIVYHIEHQADKQTILNMGTDKSTTYYEFVSDVAKAVGISKELLMPDGNETGWPEDSSLSVKKLEELAYPTMRYDEMIQTIKAER